MFKGQGILDDRRRGASWVERWSNQDQWSRIRSVFKGFPCRIPTNGCSISYQCKLFSLSVSHKVALKHISLDTTWTCRRGASSSLAWGLKLEWWILLFWCSVGPHYTFIYESLGQQLWCSKTAPDSVWGQSCDARSKFVLTKVGKHANRLQCQSSISSLAFVTRFNQFLTTCGDEVRF